MSSGFVEVADRVWVARYASFDLNVTLVGGEHGLLLIDTRASAAEARELLEDVRRIGGTAPVVAVANTHYHHDHTVGNATVAAAHPDALLICHEEAARELAEHAPDDVLIPAETFSSARVLDLGGRSVELIHPGPAHTGGDLVVRVPDADVLVAGDLVEESAPPSLGPDSYPLDWPIALDLVQQLTGPGTVVVPGHGRVVDRDFVHDQRVDLGIIAQTLRDLAGQGVPRDQALAAGSWPFPAEHLADAVARAYDQLPPEGRRLPLA